MAYQVSSTADRDLEEICDWISADNPAAAVRVLESLHATFRFLADFPQVGAARNDLEINLRAFAGNRPAQNYVIFFRPDPDGVEIVRVLRGSRDFRRIFRK